MSRNQAAANPAASWGVLHHFIMTLLKGATGFLFDCRALVADALYSASEAAGSMPGTRQRVFRLPGGKMSVWLCLVTVIMLGSMLTVISSVQDIYHGTVEAPTYGAGIAVILAMIAKEMYFRYQYREANRRSKETSDQLIEQHRVSLWSSVISLFGIFGAMAGYTLNVPVLLYCDPAAAIIISCLIAWRLWSLFSGTAAQAVVPATQEEDAQPFIETMQRVHGIITIDHLRAMEQGHYVSISAVITVNPRITVMEANDIAARAKALLMNRFSHITDVSIQFLPYDPGYPYKSNYEGSGEDLPSLLQ